MAPGKHRRQNNICAATPTPKITTPLSLAADLMLEVMTRTDFVTLVRCAATCKHLRHDILSVSFIRRVTRQSALSILAYLSSYKDQPLTLVHPVMPATESFCHSHLSPFISRHIGNLLGEYCPVTSRGGLVVLYRLRDKMQAKYMHWFDLCVYNPMTGHAAFLPKSPDVLTDVSSAQEFVLLTIVDGIGYSFMLLIIDIGISSIKVHTITSCSGVWMTVTCASHCNFPWQLISRYNDPAILLGGVVHWLVDHGNQILTYDVGTRMPGLVKLPPTNRNASQLHLATSPDGKLLKLLAIDGFILSMWLQLPTAPAGGGGGWALEILVDIEEKLRPLFHDLPIGGGPDVLVWFKASGKRSGDVVLLHVHSRGCVVLDLEMKEIHMQKCGSILLEIDLPSHLQSMKVFS